MNKTEVIDLIRDAGYGVLGTTDGNTPKVRPFMPYLDDNGNLLMATFAKKRVVEQIKANPKVEMCFIDRKMNFARVAGEAEISKEKDKKDMVWENIPMLRQYFASPEDENFVVIQINTQSVEAMTPQQKSPEIISLND